MIKKYGVHLGSVFEHRGIHDPVYDMVNRLIETAVHVCRTIHNDHLASRILLRKHDELKLLLGKMSERNMKEVEKAINASKRLQISVRQKKNSTAGERFVWEGIFYRGQTSLIKFIFEINDKGDVVKASFDVSQNVQKN